MKALADITERSAGSEDDFKMMLADLNVLTGRIERGEGTLGRILSDERAAEPRDRGPAQDEPEADADEDERP